MWDEVEKNREKMLSDRVFYIQLPLVMAYVQCMTQHKCNIAFLLLLLRQMQNDLRGKKTKSCGLAPGSDSFLWMQVATFSLFCFFFFYQVFFLPLLLRKCVWERDSLCVCTHACVCACVCMTERDRSSISSVPFRLLTVHRLPEVEKRWCGGGGADIFTAVCTRNKPKASIGWRQARGMQDTSSMCKNNPAGWEDGLPDASY